MTGTDGQSDLIRGNIDAIVLRALEPEDTYGYQVLKHVFEASGGAYEMKEPSLYACLKRLERQGWVSGYWGNESQGARRKYYHLTDAGREELTAATERWNSVKVIIDRLLEQDATEQTSVQQQDEVEEA